MPDTDILPLTHSATTASPTQDAANPKPTRAQPNHLTLKQSIELYRWMDRPDHREYVAKESDADTAAKASQELGFAITAPNILHIRKELGIQKIKPAKDPATAGDVDLVALHAQVQTLDSKLTEQTALTGKLQEIIDRLNQRVMDLAKALIA